MESNGCFQFNEYFIAVPIGFISDARRIGCQGTTTKLKCNSRNHHDLLGLQPSSVDRGMPCHYLVIVVVYFFSDRSNIIIYSNLRAKVS